MPLQALLKSKTVLQRRVQHLLQVRESLRPGGTPERAQATAASTEQRRALQETLQHEVAAAFPDRARAEEQLHRVLGLRDNTIFKGLASLGNAASMAVAAQTAKDVVQRIGSKVCAQMPLLGVSERMIVAA